MFRDERQRLPPPPLLCLAEGNEGVGAVPDLHPGELVPANVAAHQPPLGAGILEAHSALQTVVYPERRRRGKRGRGRGQASVSRRPPPEGGSASAPPPPLSSPVSMDEEQIQRSDRREKAPPCLCLEGGGRAFLARDRKTSRIREKKQQAGTSWHPHAFIHDSGVRERSSNSCRPRKHTCMPRLLGRRRPE